MKLKKFIATCPRCDNNYEIEEAQLMIVCPYCGFEIDWELDVQWYKEVLNNENEY